MQFTPFPLRARGSLEIFDAAIKLYKQYFWVLLGWSAIVSTITIFTALIPFGGFAGLFVTPLSVGSAVCCLAAAVRGQSVEFGQCWRFTQPRYWMMLGMYLLTLLIGGLMIGLVSLVFVAIGFGGVYAFQQSSGGVQAAMAIVGIVLFSLFSVFVFAIFFSWMSLVSIVICMEEDKRGTNSLGRAFEIMRGHWLRIVSLMVFVGLAIAIFYAILGGVVALVVGIGRVGDLMQGGGAADSLIWLTLGAMVLAYLVLWIICTPLYYLILSVFYLDVRVRQEGLDLEWTAHTTAPAMPAAPDDAGMIQTPNAPLMTVPLNAPTAEPAPFQSQNVPQIAPEIAPPLVPQSPEYSPLQTSTFDQAQENQSAFNPPQPAFDANATQRLDGEENISAPTGSTPEENFPAGSTPDAPATFATPSEAALADLSSPPNDERPATP